MKPKIIDQVTCPYCKVAIGITDSTQYGYRKLCPHCQGKVDIFPESDTYVETPWGTFGVHLGKIKLGDLLKMVFFAN